MSNIVDKPQGTVLNATSRARFAATLRAFSASPEGPMAKAFFALLMVLLVGINSLNVWSSYIGRDFMTAVASRDSADFTKQTFRYVAILLVCTGSAVVYRYIEERLALLAREFLTRRFVGLYLSRRFYHRLGVTQRIANPDQRIADDVKAFTGTTLSFLLMVLNALMSIVAFSGVMWSISPMLFVVTVSYAAVGTAATVWLGQPLIWFNYNQSDREAELRADLVQLRENSEFVALAHHEHHFKQRLAMRIQRVIENSQRIISINRSLNFFTTGYNYLVAVIPVLVVAPLYMRGEVEFGVIMQSTMAFAQLLGAFSLIVTQYQSISSFTAVVARLDRFSQAAQDNETAPPPPIVVTDDADSLTYDRVTLEAPEGGKVLVEDLTVHIERGTRLLVTGPGEMAKMALFRATADLWEHGKGSIHRPNHHCICFLPERPYLPPGTLRETLVHPDGSDAPLEERIRQVMEGLDLVETLERIGGLDVERDWDDLLSLGELQRLAIARVLLVAPAFALLDRIETTLEGRRMHDVLGMLDGAGITYVTIGRTDSDLPHYDMVLELTGTGPWSLHPAKVERPMQDEPPMRPDSYPPR